jgi:hypothetical protein
MRTRIHRFVVAIVPAVLLAFGLADGTLWP